MYPVIDAYKEQMARPYRNESYVRLQYGLFNVIASGMATISDNGHTKWADDKIGDTVLPDSDYITFENNRWEVGNRLKLLPRTETYQTSGFISSEISDDNGKFKNSPVVTISFVSAQTLSGLSLWFDTVLNTYPRKIKINGKEYYPSSSMLSIDEPIENVDVVTIEFIESFLPRQRVRLNRIGLGRTITFESKDLVSTSYQSSVDLISCELPKKTFSFTINNIDHVYDPLNENSLSNYVDLCQPVDIEYGYKLDDGSVYWFHGDHLVLSSNPKTSKMNATFSCTSGLQNLTQVFTRGVWTDSGKTLWDLAVEVLEFAGVDNYTLDEHMKEFTTTCPLPAVECNKLLQLIANASMCFLQEDRNGYVSFKYAPYPTISVSDNGHVSYSYVGDAFNFKTLPTQKNVSFSPNGWVVGDNRYVLLGNKYRARFVSSELSSAEGSFERNPCVYLDFSYKYEYYEIPIVFDIIGENYAVDFDVVYYNGSDEVDKLEVRGNTNVSYDVEKLVSGFNRIKIEIIKWSKPFTRAQIDRIDNGRINDFYMDFHTSQADPDTEKIQQSKTLEVVSYGYSRGEQSELYSEEFDLNGELTLNISHRTATDMSASVTVGKIVYESHYAEWSVVTIKGTGKTELTINGTEINTESNSIITKLNDSGVVRGPMTNPLISSVDHAVKVSEWISDYYKKRVKMSVTYRGNPEIDADDLIYVQSQFSDYFPVRVTKTQIDYNGAIKGKVDLVVI